jgi:hypothetical protein
MSSSTTPRPNTERILAGLKDFQRKTVDYVFQRLYQDENPVKRFLVADEVGLGKTLVARGLIARAIDHLWETIDRIDVVYICANQDIARQNVNRLNVTNQREIALATRMTMLPLHMHDLQNQKLNFVSFSPGTSFDLKSATGMSKERALIYHILRRGWRFGNSAGPKNLFQCGVTRRDWWHHELAHFPEERIDRQLAQDFLGTLTDEHKQRFQELTSRFGHYRKLFPKEDRQRRDALIGELRSLLARSCVDALEPDIVILDEFQRFKSLLDGQDAVANLARELFDYEDAKVLLLSATPYKMYTMYHEQDVDDHYRDLMRTTEFLFGDSEKTELFKKELTNYQQALFRLSADGGKQLERAKLGIETRLRSVMVRTERMKATSDHSGMITEAKQRDQQLKPRDIQAFVMLDRVARHLGQGDTIEYWKSAPYPLNMMDRLGYKLKEALIRSLEENHDPALSRMLSKGNGFLLSWDRVQRCQSVDPLNARLRTLIEDKVAKDAWQLLWVPPSLPYYAASEGPFADPQLRGFTKGLVFSAWRVVPKSIAMLASFEAERQMICALESHPDYAARRTPLLQFRVERRSDDDQPRPAAMNQLLLLYPCLSLAFEIDPLDRGRHLIQDGRVPSVETVLEEVRRDVERMMTPLVERFGQGSGVQPDERWYWAAVALLDATSGFQEQMRSWLKTNEEKITWKQRVRQTTDDSDSGFAAHVDLFEQAIESPESLELGPIPDDLYEVLAKVAIASPAVAAVRALSRLDPDESRNGGSVWLPGCGALVAMGFRTLFNLPQTMCLIRSLSFSEDARYWESSLDYCVAGNLQSVLDEYVHIMRESLGLIDHELDDCWAQIAETIESAVSLRTVRLAFDELLVADDSEEVVVKRRHIRCRFALPFGNTRDEEGVATRADQVRLAFNSPFRPFVLATTSIGQEGLDFHQYCHEIYHWNLPASPVDLEQREGRIHRYKGHVIRRNVARRFTLATLPEDFSSWHDPWETIFEQSQAERADDQDDLIPFWIFELAGNEGFSVARHIPLLPMSRDQERLEHLRRAVVAYRVVLGQPRQEDLVRYLQEHLDTELTPEDLLRFRIDLSPPSPTQPDEWV